MEFNFDSYISLDVKKARENYGDKDDTYSNMIKSFYDNVLNQNLKTIHDGIVAKKAEILMSECSSLRDAGNFVYAERIVKISEEFLKLIKGDLNNPKLMKLFLILIDEAQNLKKEMKNICTIAEGEDEIDKIEIKVRGEKKPDIKENQKKEERDGREEIQPNRQLNMEGNEENGMCSNGNCACRIF